MFIQEDPLRMKIDLLYFITCINVALIIKEFASTTFCETRENVGGWLRDNCGDAKNDKIIASAIIEEATRVRPPL